MAYHTETFIKGDRITLDEVRQIEVRILGAYIKFCEENGLRYFMAGGSLIGAVRNQGYVPWDDDIDVVMPRPDYDKFHELCKNGQLGEYEVRSIDICPDIHCRGLIRVVDPNYMTEMKSDPMFLPPWIDVFPLEGLPTDFGACVKHYDKAAYWKLQSKRARMDWRLVPQKTLTQKITKLIKKIVFWPLRNITGPVKINRKLIEIAREYKFDDCEYVGVVATGLGMRERMPKEIFLDGEVKLPFEGLMVSVPAHYDRYLTRFYGDYLTLPPARYRKIHVIDAWKVKK